MLDKLSNDIILRHNTKVGDKSFKYGQRQRRIAETERSVWQDRPSRVTGVVGSNPTLTLMNESTDWIKPGVRVKTFDLDLLNKLDTIDQALKPATVVRRYQRKLVYIYVSLTREVVDVIFDHRPNEESKGHFLSCVMPENHE